jgi:hypothetical protein
VNLLEKQEGIGAYLLTHHYIGYDTNWEYGGSKEFGVGGNSKVKVQISKPQLKRKS